MKIAYDCTKIQRECIDEGLSRYAFELISNILDIAKNHEIYLLGRKASKKALISKLVQKGAKYVPLYGKSLFGRVDEEKKQKSYLSLLKKERIDIYHSLYPEGILFCDSIKQISTHHDQGVVQSLNKEEHRLAEKCSGEKISPMGEIFQNQLKYLGSVSRVIAISNHVKKLLIDSKYAQGENIQVIYNGIPSVSKPAKDEIERIKFQYNLDKPYILLLGRFVQYKNILGAIRAFKIVKEKAGFDGYLAISGDMKYMKIKSFLSKCKKEIKTLGLKKHVKLLGYVPDEDLSGLYAGANAFLQISFMEGFGLPAVEAASFGVPMVISKIGSLIEILPDAVVVSPFDPEDIADGIVKALNGQGITFKKWRSWRETAEETLAMYEDVMELRNEPVNRVQ